MDRPEQRLSDGIKRRGIRLRAMLLPSNPCRRRAPARAGMAPILSTEQDAFGYVGLASARRRLLNRRVPAMTMPVPSSRTVLGSATDVPTVKDVSAPIVA